MEKEDELYTALSTLIIEQDDDIPYRLTAQEDALKELKCTDESYGKFISQCDYPFLMETLELDDTIFSKEFPKVRLTLEDRKTLTESLERHCESCSHCSLKRSYDFEWQSRINRAFIENKTVISKAIGYAAGRK